MTDKPSVAVRGKQHSSMVVGLRLQAAGKSDAFVSAGNTGAQMAASTFILKLHEGLTRPAIGTLFPSALDLIVVVDSGANVDCSAQELIDWDAAIIAEDRDMLEATDPDAIVDMSRKIEMHMPSDRPGMLMRTRLLKLLHEHNEEERPRDEVA